MHFNRSSGSHRQKVRSDLHAKHRIKVDLGQRPSATGSWVHSVACSDNRDNFYGFIPWQRAESYPDSRTMHPFQGKGCVTGSNPVLRTILPAPLSVCRKSQIQVLLALCCQNRKVHEIRKRSVSGHPLTSAGIKLKIAQNGGSKRFRIPLGSPCIFHKKWPTNQHKYRIYGHFELEPPRGN